MSVVRTIEHIFTYDFGRYLDHTINFLYSELIILLTSNSVIIIDKHFSYQTVRQITKI